ncbi:EVE domain-containing protein [Patescibacteria group bacterium]|jgi:predicted RNA-binding protein with PUA-like domain|nr:EVE domain-containing protein [Patescibacteria group bacterium]
MAYWLIKTDPSDYGWEDLLKDGETEWTGIRNFQARNNLSGMKAGDKVLVYNTQEDKSILGIAEVTREAAQDPTDEDKKWISVKLKAVKPVGRPLSLDEIRNTHGLAVMPLVDQPRLSVMPVTEAQWDAILKYSKTT